MMLSRNTMMLSRIAGPPKPISGSRPIPTLTCTRLICVLLALATAAGCATNKPMAGDTIAVQQAIESRKSKQDLNTKLASVAAQASANDQTLQKDYSIGPGDVLEISVFGVPELNTNERVSSQGKIMLPLVSEIDVGGKSPREVESALAERLTEFLHSPDVSVFVSEYRSQQVSVTGAVNNPAMHTLDRPRTVLELVSMSGGLSGEAGNQITVQTTMDNMPQRFVIDLDEILSNPGTETFAMLLSNGDSVFVPEAGVVFVEGAVNNPGSFSLKAGTGVLEAIAMAQGTTYDAQEGDVQVVTRGEDGEKTVVSVPLDKVRAQEAPNLTLQDGDIVLVPSNAVKRNFAGFWRGFRGVFGMGFSLNGP